MGEWSGLRSVGGTEGEGSRDGAPEGQLVACGPFNLFCALGGASGSCLRIMFRYT